MDKFKSINIYSIEAKDILIAGRNGYKTSEYKKFKATLDYSLDVEKLLTLDKNFFYEKNNKRYTNNIVSLTFKYSLKEYNDVWIDGCRFYIHHEHSINELEDKHIRHGICYKKNKLIAISLEFKCNEINSEIINKMLPKGMRIEDFNIIADKSKLKTIMTSSEIRKHLYNKSFLMDSERFIRYKRSSGSARVGKVLFINKKYYNDMMSWSYMGLDKTGIIDLAGLEAYISLTTSSIIDTLKIEPKNILLIDDFDTNIFKDKVITTKNIKNKDDSEYLFSEEEEIKFSNNIWDGQSLIDKSLLESYENKGMILLRNRFFKSACFNTNIQKFFKDNDVLEISQLNGKTIAKNISDIKLITTQSSIKYLKFGSFENYISQLENNFGIVKYEKPTKHFDGRLVSTHYQLLNSLEITKVEMKEFLSETIHYINLLKNDISVFKNHLKFKLSEELELDSIDATDSFIFNMLQHNDDFIKTDLFTDFRKETIYSYINNVKKGHVLVNGTYGVLLGNPVEMLKYSCNKWDCKTTCIPKGKVYLKFFKNGERLIGTRSPHVNAGNVLLIDNIHHELDEYAYTMLNEYFNLTDNISVINSFDDNILERLSSADFDSDQVAFSNNKTLIKCAEKNYENLLVPTSLVSGSKKPRMNRGSQKADLDVKTSVNLIGEIINCAQILNSIYWDSKLKNTMSKEQLNELYVDICQLNVMSCIEIDKAKKEFLIDNKKELKKIKNRHYIKDDKKVVKPIFFKFLAELNNFETNCIYSNYDCPMDYLHIVLDEEIKKRCKTPRRKSDEKLEVADLFARNDINITGYNRKKMQSVLYEALRVKKYMSSIWSSKEYIGNKYLDVNQAKNDFIMYLKDLDLNVETIKKIIHYVGRGRKSKTLSSLKSVNRFLFSSLFLAYKNEFLMILESTRQDNFVLLAEEDVNSLTSTEIYGIKYYYVENKIKNKTATM